MNDINFCINPGKSKSFSFDGSGCENAGRLFITGETNISPYWKTEPDYQMLYRRIDDSLVSSHDGSDRFALDLSGGRRHYPLVAYRKLVTPFQTPMHILNDCTNRWKFGISVKADKLRIYGYLKVTVEVRYLNGNTSRHSTVDEPDQIFTIDVPEGKYGWNILSKEIEIDLPHVANVCYFVEGEDFEGKVLFEAPHFTSESGHNLVGQFIPHTEDRQGVNWLGQNLSHIEWIGMQIDINGKRIFDGEIFERCHRFSENEIIIPEGLVRSGENEITFTCS